MVAFGQSLVEARRPQWEAAYLDYNHLKKILSKIEFALDSRKSFRLMEDVSFRNLDDLEQHVAAIDLPPPPPPPPPPSILSALVSPLQPTAAVVVVPLLLPPVTPRTLSRQRTMEILKSEFFVVLQSEIEKISLFTLKQQGRLADAVGSLRFGNELAQVFQNPPNDKEDTKNKKKKKKNEEEEEEQNQNENDDKLQNGQDETLRLCSVAAVEMVHLLRFICINAVGIQKILKKYNKVFERLDEPHYYMLSGGSGSGNGSGDGQNGHQRHHLEQLAHSESILAIQSSLQTALLEQFSRYDIFDTKESALAYYRFQCILECSATLRRNAALLHQPFLDFLSRQAMIVTGTNFGEFGALGWNGGVGGATTTSGAGAAGAGGGSSQGQRMMQWLFQLRPDVMLSVNDNHLRRIWNWNRWMGGVSSGIIFDPATLLKERDEATGSASGGSSSSTMDLVEGGGDGLAMTPTTSASHRRLRLPTIDEEDLEDMAQRVGVLSGVNKKQQGTLVWGGVNASTMRLNLLSTLLYTVNYYIVAPTANHYAIKLGSDGAFGATLIGASSFSAIFAAFLYSLWYTKSSFQSALIFSTLCPLVGNLVYALAISFNSMPMAIGGRILCGFGSAEVVNRQLISSCVDFEGMTQASALFVAAGAIGMSLGPLLAGILDVVCGRDANVDFPLPFYSPAGGIILDHVTAPGFVMTGLWSLQLVGLIFIFREPIRINSESSQREQHPDDPSLDSDVSSNVSSKKSNGSDEEDEENEANEGTPLKKVLRSSSSSSSTNKNQISKTTTQAGGIGIWHELVFTVQLIFRNPGLPVTLLIFSFIELTDEVIISSCSMVVRRYFNWPASVSGFLIASLGALVLPAHFVVEKASRHYSERKILLKSIIALVICLAGIVNYTGLYYDTVGFITKLVTPGDGSVHDVDIVINGHKAKKLLSKTSEFAYDSGLGAYAYMIFLSATFMGTIVLEGVDTSIMAKVTPPELNDRFINSGLLATLIGTMGRVIGDSMITFSALADLHVFVDFVNATFVPLLVLAVGGIFLVKANYKSLV